jgi:hypothetical protein
MKKPFQGFLTYVAFIVGVVSGIAQLADFSHGLGQMLLTAVGISCLLFLIVRITLSYYVRLGGQRRRELAEAKRLIDTLQVGHQRYVDAIDRIIDQEGPIYAESLEITVTVGIDDDGDTIVERRRTTPKPRVTQRAIRPIVPNDGVDRIVTLDDLDLSYSLQDPTGDRVYSLTDIAGGITTLPIGRNGKPRAWLVFDPGLTEPFDWMLHYRPAGLWKPLRRDGSDWLKWNDRLPAGAQSNSVLTDLVVKFVFPAGERQPTVSELHGFGTVSAPARRDGGGWVITWQDPRPQGRTYEWNLAQGRPPDRAATPAPRAGEKQRPRAGEIDGAPPGNPGGAPKIRG